MTNGLTTAFLILIGLLLPQGATAGLPGPREPLTFRNSGLYCAGADYQTRSDVPFDFSLVAANGPFEGRDNAPWAKWLGKARANGKRVIALLNPQIKNAKGEFDSLDTFTSPVDNATLDHFMKVIGEFFAQVNINDLYAITLDEENVFWNGGAQTLAALYQRMKAKYDIPVYQWFSPSSQGSSPGISGYPNIKADGWVADEYYLDQPLMEHAMRAYIIQQKPIIQTIWAGGEKASVPFILKRFWEQVDVCRKYDIPTAYFTWYGEGGAWGFSEDAPPSLKKTFDTVFQTATRARLENGGALNTAAWDFVPWTIPTIKLEYTSPDNRTAVYRENYAADRVVRFINEAEIRGFADVRWDSSSVELRPRKAGPAQATLTYRFDSTFPINELRISAPVTVAPGNNAQVTLSVTKPDGKPLKTARATSDGVLSLVVDAEAVRGEKFNVVFEMKGTASSVPEVLAGIVSLSVAADVRVPKQKLIEIQPDSLGGICYEEDLRSMSIYHSATIKNPQDILRSTSGLHANVPVKETLEVVQKFAVPPKQRVGLIRLRATGSADEKGYKARFGIGLSHNGVDLLEKKMSQGTFTGDVEIDLKSLKRPSPSGEFYVHLFLEGGFGVISSYVIEGAVAK